MNNHFGYNARLLVNGVPLDTVDKFDYVSADFESLFDPEPEWSFAYLHPLGVRAEVRRFQSFRDEIISHQHVVFEGVWNGPVPSSAFVVLDQVENK